MKLWIRLFAGVLAAVSLLAAGCGGKKGGVKADVMAKLNESGALTPFIEQKSEDDWNWRYPDVSDAVLPVTEPIYTVRWTWGKPYLDAAEGDFSAEDALTRGTLVFLNSEFRDWKNYKDKRGEAVIGHRETLQVYLYDLETGTVFASAYFYGEPLKDSYDAYSGAHEFYHYADMDEVRAWIDSYPES